MPSFGEELKRERELRRITLREVSDATKINLRYLEALERNDFQHLPGGVFNRGFVRAFAQFIGVDPDQMVSAYVLEERSQSKTTGTPTEEPLLPGTASLTNTSARSTKAVSSDADGEANARLKIGLIILAVLVLLAGGAFVYYKFFRGASSGAANGSSAPQSAPQEAQDAQGPSSGPALPATASDGGSTGQGSSPSDSPHAEATENGTQGGAAEPANAPPRNQPRSPGATPRPAAQNSVTATDPVRATVFIDKATTGRINCDNRQIELLRGMLPGSQFEVSCRSFLIVDAADGGALRIGWPGVEATAPGAAGTPLSGHRIDIRATGNGPQGGTP